MGIKKELGKMRTEGCLGPGDRPGGKGSGYTERA